MSDQITIESLNAFCELRHEPQEKAIDRFYVKLNDVDKKLGKIYIGIFVSLCAMVMNLTLILILNKSDVPPKIEIKIDKETIKTLSMNEGG